jgi:pimeloyl-ACP methyl ester carboxylesterase
MKLDVCGQSTYCYTNNRDIDQAKDSIIFLHGAGMDHTVWTLPARHFARHGRNVIAVDLPGHGRSDGAALTSIEAISDWLVALLGALQLTSAAITGHSMGSLVAIDCAARHPDRVSAIALVGSTAPMPVSDAILDASAANDHSAFDMLTQWGYSKRHQYGGNSNPGVWMVGSTLRLYERARPGVLNADMSACNNYSAGLERAANISCPVLMILGEDDRLTPVRSTMPLQGALPDPRVITIENSGHSLMTEAPNAVLDALKTIL